MKRPTDRRTILMAAGAAAVAAASGTVAAAQSTDIRGAVAFEGGAVVPKGQLEIYLEDPAIQDKTRRRAAKTSVKSDGGSKTIAFSLPMPSTTASQRLQVVARLERADGWLLARGSAQFEAGSTVHVTLNTVMY